MERSMIFVSILMYAICAGIIFVYIDFLVWLYSGSNYFVRFRKVLGVMEMIFALLTLAVDIGEKNDCCNGSAIFSPSHRLTAFVRILACIAAFLYSLFRKKAAPPLIEIVVNCLLLIGIPLNIFVGIQVNGHSWYPAWPVWLAGHIPIALLFIIALGENHRIARQAIGQSYEGENESRLLVLCRRLLFLPGWQKFPILFVLCLPLLAIVMGLLLVFGQKPDSIVRAFTETYKHGFSTLNYECDNVNCGGHFLCSVAAAGHPGLVKPVRRGIRGGKPIQCNRQLLVSNAFEELLEQQLPSVHRPIRRLYNRVGHLVHRHDDVFGKKWVANLIYVLMKPPEAVFTFVLYCCDRNPESRIAQQYMRWEDRAAIAAGETPVNRSPRSLRSLR